MQSFTKDGLEPTETAREYAARVGGDVRWEGESSLTAIHEARVAQALVVVEMRKAHQELKREGFGDRVLRVVFGIGAGRTRGWQ